jgi:hypothetical protein
MMKAEVRPETKLERILLPSTTFDITLTVELSFEVPSIHFDETQIHKQLGLHRHIWLRGAKLDKESLAQALGMESCKFLFVGGYQNVGINKITISKFDCMGNRVNEKE